MKQNRSIKIILLSLVIVLQYACKTTPVEIKLNLETGKEYTQNTVSTIITKIGFVDGPQRDVSMTIAAMMSFAVESESDTAYFVEATYEELSMTIKMPQVPSIKFDSKGEDDLMSKSFKGLINNPFKVNLLKNGKVSFIDMETFWAKFDSSLTWIPSIQKEQIIEQSKQAYGEEAVKGNFEQFFAIFPEKPVNKGEKWHTQIELNANFPATMDSEYKLVKITSDYFLIEAVSTISTNGLQNAKSPSSNGELKQYDLTGTAISNIKIDRTTGWVTKANVEQVIQGKSIIGGLEMSMEMIANIEYIE